MEIKMTLEEAICRFHDREHECGGYHEVLCLNGMVATAVSDNEAYTKGPNLTLQTEKDFILEMEEC